MTGKGVCILPGSYSLSQYPPREIITVVLTRCRNAQYSELNDLL
jgi:hypothetical protein